MSVAFLRPKIIRQKREVIKNVMAGTSEGSFFYGEKKY